MKRFLSKIKLREEVKALRLSLTGISTDIKTEPAGCPCPGACSALKVVERNEKLESAYNELIMAVARKYPDESRHQTALRYIRDRESTTVSGRQSTAACEDEAPHGRECNKVDSYSGRLAVDHEAFECTCWKSGGPK